MHNNDNSKVTMKINMNKFMLIILLTSISSLQIYAQSQRMSTAFTTGNYQPVGITITSENRIFVSFPNWLPAYDNAVCEVFIDENKLSPYPDKSWNNWKTDRKDKTQFVSVQNVVADKQNNLWILDPANSQLGESRIDGIKLVKINLNTNQVERIYTFPKDVVGKNSFLNDVQIDEKHRKAYLPDPSQKAFIVLDLVSGKAKRVLQNHPTLTADPNFVFKLNGIEIRDSKGNPFSSSVNGVAITKDFKWLYFRPESGVKLYRIETKYLSDFSLTDRELAKYIQDLGYVGQSNGLIADSKGNIYLTAAMDKAIKRYTPDKKIEILVQDDALQWPDTFTLSPDEKYLYVSLSQINKMSWFNKGSDMTEKPFRIMKIEL